MPTSSIETIQIENYLSGKQEPGEALLFEAKLILQPELSDNIQWQQKTYSLVRFYGRQQTKDQIKEVENLLFNSSAYSRFRKKIFKIFNY